MPPQICSRCVLPDYYPGITFDGEGVCSLCREYDTKWAQCRPGDPERRKQLDQLCQDAKAKKSAFDALVPLSGGKDSTYCLYIAVKELGLRCLAVTLDNGFLSDHARLNIVRACRKLGVPSICYAVDPKLMRPLFRLFMRKTGYFCSVCMRGIGMVTDWAADLYDIPLVLGGSSSRTELPLVPEMFQPGPPDYIARVLQGERIAEVCGPLLRSASWKRWLGYRVFWWGSQRRIRITGFINLPDYIEWNYDVLYRTIKTELDWQSPADNEEHTDCMIHPVSEYLHNRRFPGLEIERLTLARLIMAGQITRDEALRRLEQPQKECPQPAMSAFLDATGLDRKEFDSLVDMGPRHLAFRPEPGRLWQLARRTKRFAWSVLGIRKS